MHNFDRKFPLLKVFSHDELKNALVRNTIVDFRKIKLRFEGKNRYTYLVYARRIYLYEF